MESCWSERLRNAKMHLIKIRDLAVTRNQFEWSVKWEIGLYFQFLLHYGWVATQPIKACLDQIDIEGFRF